MESGAVCRYCQGRIRLMGRFGDLIWYECSDCHEKFCEPATPERPGSEESSSEQSAGEEGAS